MKKLFLIRHAKSSWKDASLADYERPLNKRGMRDAPFMGQRLARENVLPDIILSSPANRAITTAGIIADEIGYSKDNIVQDESIYLATDGMLLDIIRHIDDQHQSAFVFGHNPGFTMIANNLCNHYIDNLPTCGIFAIQFNIHSWKDVGLGEGTFDFFDYPKKHIKDG